MTIPWLLVAFVAGSLFDAAFSVAVLIVALEEMPVTLTMPKGSDLQ